MNHFVIWASYVSYPRFSNISYPERESRQMMMMTKVISCVSFCDYSVSPSALPEAHEWDFQMTGIFVHLWTF
jgi:hypothetical protein